MSTAILLSTSSSQKLCQKTQSTRRRRRHVHPEDPDHSNGQDRQPTAKRTATLADCPNGSNYSSIEFTDISYLSGVSYRSRLAIIIIVSLWP